MRVLWLLLLIGVSESSLALRCGNQLVTEGDSRYEVKTLCGSPDDVVTNSYYRSISNGAVYRCEQPLQTHSVESLGEIDNIARSRSCLALVEDRLAARIDVDVWLYDFGKNRFMQRLHFENGRVVRIEQLGYGIKGRH